MVKRFVRKILQKNKLIYKELQTVVIEIEGILNTRPLCCIHDNSPDSVVTPSHLIYGRNLLAEFQQMMQKMISRNVSDIYKV